MSDMGSPALIHQSPGKEQAIVAFDFDGTLTVRDSFTGFLRWRAGGRGWNPTSRGKPMVFDVDAEGH